MNQNLRRVPFFAGLSDDALHAIQERLVLKRYRKGEVVFSEGMVGDSMYLVESGQVAVISEGAPGAPETIIAYHGPGSFFGEMALLLGERRSATIRVTIDAELWQLHKSDLDALLRAHPSIGVIMSRELSRRLSRTIHQPAEEQVVNLIAVLGRQGVALVEALAALTGERLLILDLGGVQGNYIPARETISYKCFPIGAGPEQLAETLSEEVGVYDRVVMTIARQETASARKAAELAEIVVEIGGRTTPWVKRFARENYVYIANEPALIQATARRIARRRVGLALSAGNARGIAHIGVLKVLEEAGIPIDIIAGTSAGALFGGLYCAGRTVEEIADFARRLPKATSLLGGLYDIPLVPKSGFIRGHKTVRYLQSFFEDKTFDQLRIPLRAVAADVITGEEVILKTGSVAEAVRASFSIPGIFEPALIDGRRLIDGGAVNPVPVSVLVGEADILIGCSVIPSLTDRIHRREMLESGRMPNMLGIFLGTMEIMEAGLIESHMGSVDILIQPDVTRYGTLEYDRADELIAAGEEAARRMLPAILAKLRAGHRPTPTHMPKPGRNVAQPGRLPLDEKSLPERNARPAVSYSL